MYMQTWKHMNRLHSSRAKWDFATKRPKSRGKLAELAMSLPPDLRDEIEPHVQGIVFTEPHVPWRQVTLKSFLWSLKWNVSPSPCPEVLHAVWFGIECAWWSCPSTKVSKASVQTHIFHYHLTDLTLHIELPYDDMNHAHRTQGPSAFPYPISGFNDHPPQYPMCLGCDITHMFWSIYWKKSLDNIYLEIKALGICNMVQLQPRSQCTRRGWISGIDMMWVSGGKKAIADLSGFSTSHHIDRLISTRMIKHALEAIVEPCSTQGTAWPHGFSWFRRWPDDDIHPKVLHGMASRPNPPSITRSACFRLHNKPAVSRMFWLCSSLMVSYPCLSCCTHAKPIEAGWQCKASESVFSATQRRKHVVLSWAWAPWSVNI